jgi:molybdopterin molybdotransferase
MLLEALRHLGCHPVDLGSAPDDEEGLRRVFQDLPELDAVVTTGGASMGERDLLKRVLATLGLDLAFWRARIRPGSPVSFGHLTSGGRRIPLFGLPGNPASAFVTFAVLVAPFLARRMGSPSPLPGRIRAITLDALDSPARLTHFFRVALSWHDGDVRCALTGPQSSGLVRPLLGAGGLAVVEEGVSRVEAGERIEVILLPWGMISQGDPGAERA